MPITKHQRELLQYAAKRDTGRVYHSGGPLRSVRLLINAGLAEERHVVTSPKDQEILRVEMEIWISDAKRLLAADNWRGALSALERADRNRHLLAETAPFITDAGRAEAAK